MMAGLRIHRLTCLGNTQIKQQFGVNWLSKAGLDPFLSVHSAISRHAVSLPTSTGSAASSSNGSALVIMLPEHTHQPRSCDGLRSAPVDDDTHRPRVDYAFVPPVLLCLHNDLRSQVLRCPNHRDEHCLRVYFIAHQREGHTVIMNASHTHLCQTEISDFDRPWRLLSNQNIL